MDFIATFIGRPNTIRTYTSLFRNHIEPLAGGWAAQNWSSHETNRLLVHWQHQGLAPRTIQSLIRLLAAWIKFNGGPKFNTKDLIRKVGRLRQDEELKVLNNTQSKQLMRTCRAKDSSFYPILLLGLHAGLRRGEIFGLACGDVDSLKGRVRVAHSYDGPTKSGKTRFVPMSKDLANIMIAARNLAFRDAESLIFEKMDPNPRLRRVLRAAGLPDMPFHNLRHTFATLALEAGKSPKEVQLWLGHSSVATTLSIYWNIIDQTSNVDFLPKGD